MPKSTVHDNFRVLTELIYGQQRVSVPPHFDPVHPHLSDGQSNRREGPSITSVNHPFTETDPDHQHDLHGNILNTTEEI